MALPVLLEPFKRQEGSKFAIFGGAHGLNQLMILS